MHVRRIEPPRAFPIAEITLSHCADVELDPDELVTFTTPSGTALDVTRKEWGYYATSSNRRLRAHGLRMVLCANDDERLSLMLVEAGHEEAFSAYAREQPMRVVAWLDSDEAAAEALRRLDAPP